MTESKNGFRLSERVISFVLAWVLALSCIAVGIPSFSLKAKAKSADSTDFYQYQNGELVKSDNSQAQTYVDQQRNSTYRYFASYKVPKRKEGRPAVGSDIFKVKTYVSGYTNNGTGSEGKHYFYADSQLTGIFGVTTPLDGGLRLISNTSVWHKQALTFTTANDSSSNGKKDSDGFVNARDGEDSSTDFFPDNFYVHWTLAQNWDMYNIQFAIKDYLSGKNFAYFGNGSKGITRISDGAVWVDSTSDDPHSYTQAAADKPKNIYLPTKESEFKSNTNVGTNGKTEDIHPFLYMATATLPNDNSQDNPYDGTSLNLNVKGVDQYGVNYKALSYSIAGVPSTVKINATTGEITGANNLTSTYKAIVTVTGKSRNTDVGSVTAKIPVYLGTTDPNAALKTRMNSWSNNAGQDADFGDAQFVATNEADYAYVNAQTYAKYKEYFYIDKSTGTVTGATIRIFDSSNNGMTAFSTSLPRTTIASNTGLATWNGWEKDQIKESENITSFPVGIHFACTGSAYTLNYLSLGVGIYANSYFDNYSQIKTASGTNYVLIENQTFNKSKVGGGGTDHQIDVAGANSEDKINLYPFLYRYTLGGTLYS
ncbi:MAG: hypothetical protein MJ143_06030, partial [Clostridia bacterium]|nr:hypothetical protein [Clostridia bacterium]